MVATLKTTVIQDPSSATANLTLDASGGVSVGQNLSVTGTTTFTGGSTFTGNATAAAFIPTGSSAPTNGLFLPAANSAGIATNSIERLRIDSSGNVGIGTSSPSNTLDVNGVSRFRQELQINPSGTVQSRIGIGTYSGSSAILGIGNDSGATANTVAFYNAGSERMRIDSSGNVGIGTGSITQLFANYTQLGIKGGSTVAGGTLQFLNSAGTITTNLVSDTNGTYLGAVGGTYIVFSVGGSGTGTERMRITSNGGVSFGSSGTAYGTSGQVLQSNGDAAPSWTTISATGALIRAPQVLTSGTSYTTPSNCTRIYVQMVGGGGGGGGANQDSNSTGAGGGGGGYLEVVATVTGSTAYTYAIGAGGAGGPRGFGGGNGGSPGGSTTLTISGTTYTAGGGSGGSPGQNPAGVQAGGAGGTSTNGTFNIRGSAGANSGGAGNTAVSGGGGGGIFASNITPGGSSASLYGSGGSTNASNTAANAGGQGVIRIWEYT